MGLSDYSNVETNMLVFVPFRDDSRFM